MNRVWGPENELGIKTIFFTIMGPLVNPADARRHILGVYKPELVGMIGDVLAKLNFKHALVVHGVDGYDEISLVGKTMVAEVKEGKVERYEITPEELGLKRCSPEDIGGGSPEFNAKVIRSIFEGKERGPRRDFLMLNLAGALYVGGKASSLRDGVELAKEIIDSGKAQKKLEEFVKASKEIKARK
jgi:anthranilate phosphoribosyltransferase